MEQKLNAMYEREHNEIEEISADALTYAPEEFAAEMEYQARRTSEETQNAEGVHIGDMFYSQWGYDQTNIDFWQVVALKGKHTVVLSEVMCKGGIASSYNGVKRPIRDKFVNGKQYEKRTRYDDYIKGTWIEVPELYGHHRLHPTEFNKLYDFSTGA